METPKDRVVRLCLCSLTLSDQFFGKIILFHSGIEQWRAAHFYKRQSSSVAVPLILWMKLSSELAQATMLTHAPLPAFPNLLKSSHHGPLSNQTLLPSIASHRGRAQERDAPWRASHYTAI